MVFTVEERHNIEACLRSGRYEDIGACIIIEDPIREYQVQLIKAQLVPVVVVEESKVLAEITKAEQSNGGKPVIDTPEEEAKWQARINDEKKNAKPPVDAVRALGTPMPCCGSLAFRHKKGCTEAK